MSRKPCGECAYRRGIRAADITGGFDVEHFASLRMAAVGEGPGAVSCHKLDSSDKWGSACMGWVHDQVRRGMPNLGLRMAQMIGVVPFVQRDPNLLTYEEVLRKMESDPDAMRGGL